MRSGKARGRPSARASARQQKPVPWPVRREGWGILKAKIWEMSLQTPLSEPASEPGLGVGTDLALRGGANVVQRVFGPEGGVPASAKAYEAQEALGITPSIGSVGGPTASSLENAFAEAPVVAAISGAMPGRSAAQIQRSQREALEGALPQQVTDPLRGGNSGPMNDAELAAEVGQLADTVAGRYRGDIDAIEDNIGNMVPPGTPVPMGPIRRVPGDLEKDFRGANVRKPVEENIKRLEDAPGLPVNVQRAQKLEADKARLQGQNEQISQQISRLRASDGDPKQIKSLERQLAKNDTAIGRVDKQIFSNTGRPFQSVRDERTDLGVGLDSSEGLNKYARSALYDPTTRAMETAVANVRGPKGRAEFRAYMQAEKEIYDKLGIVKPYQDRTNSALITPVRNMITKGNWEELDAIVLRATPEEADALRGNLIDMLGRNTAQEAFQPATFATRWRSMPQEAKDLLFQGNLEGLAIAEAVAETAEDFVARGRQANRSNTAATAGVIAGLAAGVSAPAKIIPFLMSATGIERAVVSEAMAKAVAGKPTELGTLMRRAVAAQAGQLVSEVAPEEDMP